MTPRAVKKSKMIIGLKLPEAGYLAFLFCHQGQTTRQPAQEFFAIIWTTRPHVHLLLRVCLRPGCSNRVAIHVSQRIGILRNEWAKHGARSWLTSHSTASV